MKCLNVNDSQYKNYECITATRTLVIAEHVLLLTQPMDYMIYSQCSFNSMKRSSEIVKVLAGEANMDL